MDEQTGEGALELLDLADLGMDRRERDVRAVPQDLTDERGERPLGAALDEEPDAARVERVHRRAEAHRLHELAREVLREALRRDLGEAPPRHRGDHLHLGRAEREGAQRALR